MPEQNESTNTASKAPSKVLLEVTRFDATLPFVEQEKIRGDTERKPDNKGVIDQYYLLKGETYPAPQITSANLDTAIKWLSPSVVAKMLQAKMTQWAQGLYEEVREQGKGNIDLDLFAKLAEQFSPRGEKISALREQLEDIMAQMGELDTDSPEGMLRVKELISDAKAISSAIKSKKRATEEEKSAATAGVN